MEDSHSHDGLPWRTALGLAIIAADSRPQSSAPVTMPVWRNSVCSDAENSRAQ